MAPEICLDQDYGLAVDIWSLGIMLFEMLMGYYPQAVSNKEELKRMFIRGQVKIPARLCLTYDCIDFLNRCL